MCAGSKYIFSSYTVLFYWLVSKEAVNVLVFRKKKPNKIKRNFFNTKSLNKVKTKSLHDEESLNRRIRLTRPTPFQPFRSAVFFFCSEKKPIKILKCIFDAIEPLNFNGSRAHASFVEHDVPLSRLSSMMYKINVRQLLLTLFKRGEKITK